VRLFDHELELPSRVSAEDHHDDAVTVPLPLGIATVSEDELPANDATPCIVAAEPLAGLNTISHRGVFSPPLPRPVELKLIHLKVTDLQVVVALTVCACALAAKIATNPTASKMMLRERRTITRLAPARIVAGVNLSVVMLALLLAGFWICRRHSGKSREATSDEELSRKGAAKLRRARDGFRRERLVLEAVGAAGTADCVRYSRKLSPTHV
jgi:hypothetical protein